jgi:tetratricopeptide (TPR) repeat protein
VPSINLTQRSSIWSTVGAFVVHAEDDAAPRIPHSTATDARTTWVRTGLRRNATGYGMRRGAYWGIAPGLALTLMLALLKTSAVAQNSDLSNVDLCNGRSDIAAEQQINGCTALLNSVDNQKILAIVYNNRGNAYTSAGQYDLAVKDYDEATKADPTYPKPFNNRGVAYQKKGDYDHAMQDFTAAISIDPDYANAFANRAETYQKKGDYANALRDFDTAIHLQPTLSVLWNERCWTHTMLGELSTALADCNQAIKIEQNDSAAFDSRGFTYLKSGSWDLAIADYNSALRIEPKLPSALYGRGFAKLKTGDQAGGKADIAAAQAVEQNIVEEFARYGLH